MNKILILIILLVVVLIVFIKSGALIESTDIENRGVLEYKVKHYSIRWDLFFDYIRLLPRKVINNLFRLHQA
jgi:hypothetical protein